MEDWSDNNDELDPNLATIMMVGNWIDNSPVCQAICDDAREGCEESEKLISGICTRMDTVQFFMQEEYLNYDRIERELNDLVNIITELNE